MLAPIRPKPTIPSCITRSFRLRGPILFAPASAAIGCARMAPLKPADALVLFGATGDLAHKQIWPALHAMAKRGALTVPVVGIAYSQWDRDKALDYARTAVEAAGASIEDDAWKRIEHDFQYVDGDYRDPETFRALAKALGDARSPMHYLAIPPSLFATVVQSLGAAGLAD